LATVENSDLNKCNSVEINTIAWLSGNTLVSINIVNLHRARLVHGWVTSSGGYIILVCSQPPRSFYPPWDCKWVSTFGL